MRFLLRFEQTWNLQIPRQCLPLEAKCVWLSKELEKEGGEPLLGKHSMAIPLKGDSTYGNYNMT